MHFPTSGVDCPIWAPPAAAFVLALVTAPAGLSGAFLLLPLQMSLLGYVSPGVTPTNLLYNCVSLPGGVYRYIHERRMLWPLAAAIILGTVPGILVGAVIRVRYLPDARSIKPVVAAVLLYMGIRLLRDALAPKRYGRLPAAGTMKTTHVSLRRVDYDFSGMAFTFNPITMFGLSVLVGLIGGVYGGGGGAMTAPFAMTVLDLPAYTVAGAAMAGTIFGSLGGVACFQWLGGTSLAAGASVRPDWMLGLLFGAGGLAGSYCGARLQKHMPERWIRLSVGVVVMGLAVMYTVQFFI